MSDFPTLISHPIPRVSARALTSDTFKQLFVKQNIPVIITDALEHWFTNQSGNEWSLEQLQSVIGNNVMHNVFQSYDGRYKYFQSKKQTSEQSSNQYAELASNQSTEPKQSRMSMTFNEFVEKARNNPSIKQSDEQHIDQSSDQPSYYLYGEKLPLELTDRLTPPALLPVDQSINSQSKDAKQSDNPISQLTSSLLWVAINGSISPLHYDLSDGLLGQMIGEKHFTLIDPSVPHSILKPYPVGHPHDRQSSLTMPPRHERFQSGDQANNQSIDCFEGIVGPGELIYLPYAWWHQVESINQSNSRTVCQSVSITYRFNQSPSQQQSLQSVGLTEHVFHKQSMNHSICAQLIGNQLFDSLNDCSIVVPVMYMLRSKLIDQFVAQSLLPALPNYQAINQTVEQIFKTVDQIMNEQLINQSNHQITKQSVNQSDADVLIDCARTLYRQGCDQHTIERTINQTNEPSVIQSLLSTAEVQNRLIDSLLEDPLMKAYPTNESVTV